MCCTCGCSILVFDCTGLGITSDFACCVCTVLCGGTYEGGNCDCLCPSAVYNFSSCVGVLFLLVGTLKEIGIN